jgi:hypothetical protein
VHACEAAGIMVQRPEHNATLSVANVAWQYWIHFILQEGWLLCRR